MDAIPVGSGRRPRYGTVRFVSRKTHGVAASAGLKRTMIEGLRAVVADAHLRTLRDMPMSVMYCAMANAYSKNCGKECAISKWSL